MQEQEDKYTNQLINETSPYLLQHAHNPVDWHPWGEEAFEKAKKEDKPVLVSIGYSACHWCHVMEHESFEDPAVAKIMNKNFINIKVDREERPDVDQIYIAAVQAMTGSGGWPLNVFLTPEKKPFYGGTYFPPRSGLGRPSWEQVLKSIAETWHERRAEVEEQADKLMAHLEQGDERFISSRIFKDVDVEKEFTAEEISKAYENLKGNFDARQGGYGDAPKFLGTLTTQFLLRYHYYTKDADALDQAMLTLDKMIMGGLYDQLGGGFARYSTDDKWLVPHFEKMLYDNALMVVVLSEAYKLTGKALYKETIEETLEFIEREMAHPKGGFYSALDADSEGEEGKFYVWKKTEIDEILGEDAKLFNDFYDVSVFGNWEGKNILNRKYSYKEFAEKKNINEQELREQLRESRQKLFTEREKRVRPGLDDKILLSWNALMITAYAEAYKALKEDSYKRKAEESLSFLFKNFKKNDSFYFHTYKEGKAKYNAFLEDYAYLIEALLSLYEANFNEQHIRQAADLTQHLFDNYYDTADNMFYFTAEGQEDLIVRKKEFFDGAMPSGNSTMAINLYKLGIISGNEKYKKTAAKMTARLKERVISYPSSLSRWANAMVYLAYPTNEIAVVGKDAFDMAAHITAEFIPNKVIMASESEKNEYPLLAGKKVEGKTLIYLCFNYACKYPVDNIEAFKEQIINND